MKDINKKLTALLFMLVLIGMVIALLFNFDGIKSGIQHQYQQNTTSESTFLERINAGIVAVENQLDQKNPLRNMFINLNGGFQRLVGKQVLEDADPQLKVHRLDNGQLTFTVKPTETDWKAKNLADLSTWCAAKEIPLLYVQAPFKIDPSASSLPAGTVDNTNRNADALLADLKQQGVDYLDLRKVIAEQGIDHSSLFYKTDSHWTTHGAFFAYQSICHTLKTQYGFTIDDSVTELKNFNSTVYKDIFLGSQGKRVGTLYAGVDDVEVLLPKFETNLRYQVPNHSFDKQGSFHETVMDYAHIEETDYFEKSPYYVYSGGDYPLSHITNLNRSDGKKVLLVRDSFSCAVAPFLSLAVGQVDTFDLRYNDTALKDYIAESRPDIVLFLYNPGVIRDDVMFKYE